MKEGLLDCFLILLFLITYPIVMIFVLIFGVIRWFVLLFISPFRRLMLRAIETNNLKLLRFLLNSGLSPNFSLNKKIPVKLVVDARNEAALQLLLEHRADLGRAFFLNEVISQGDIDLAHYLLSHGGQAKVGVLALAAERGYIDLVEQLLARGYDPNHKDEVSSDFLFTYPNAPSDVFLASPLFIAAARRNYPLVKLLLAHGANPDQKIDALDRDHDYEPFVACSIREMAASLGDEQILACFNAAR
jgi:hypothetical protein